jgi:hypothetical protein
MLAEGVLGILSQRSPRDETVICAQQDGSDEYDYDFGDYEDTLGSSDLKSILLDSVISTNRGFDASSEVKP